MTNNRKTEVINKMFDYITNTFGEDAWDILENKIELTCSEIDVLSGMYEEDDEEYEEDGN